VADTSNLTPKRERDIHYYRQRFKNRVFEKLVSFFLKEAEGRGITRKDVAMLLRKDPAQVSRWLSSPGNLPLDTISDLLLALDAEVEPISIVRFADKKAPNYAHPMIDRIIGRQVLPPSHGASFSPDAASVTLLRRDQAIRGNRTGEERNSSLGHSSKKGALASIIFDPEQDLQNRDYFSSTKMSAVDLVK
jgi:hypothetical protein